MLLVGCQGASWALSRWMLIAHPQSEEGDGNPLQCSCLENLSQEGRRGSEETVPGPSVFPSGDPGVSGDFWAQPIRAGSLRYPRGSQGGRSRGPHHPGKMGLCTAPVGPAVPLERGAGHSCDQKSHCGLTPLHLQNKQSFQYFLFSLREYVCF